MKGKRRQRHTHISTVLTLILTLLLITAGRDTGSGRWRCGTGARNDQGRRTRC